MAMEKTFDAAEAAMARRVETDSQEYRDRIIQANRWSLIPSGVIEVGVDIPQATVLVVEGAEHLGLAQLHQLRGRVGRGSVDSWCLLFGKASAAERFELLERTNDGFEIAEEDLRRRGMGDLDGLRQSGGALDPEEDLDLLLAARDAVASDPALAEAYLVDGTPGESELSP